MILRTQTLTADTYAKNNGRKKLSFINNSGSDATVALDGGVAVTIVNNGHWTVDDHHGRYTVTGTLIVASNVIETAE